MTAAARGCDRLATTLLVHGADVHAKDEYGLAALHIAFKAESRHSSSDSGMNSLIKILLDAGADINTQCHRGFSPLIAGMFGDSQGDLFQILIDRGADINHRTRCGKTAAMATASCVQSKHRLHALIAAGADLHAQNDEGMTALSIASSNGHTEAVQVLLQQAVVIDHRNKRGETPLFLAALKGRPASVALLVAKGVQIESTNISGYTPLYVAARHYIEIPEKEHHAHEVTVREGSNDDYHGIWQTKKVEILLEAGADPTFTDAEGYTPDYWASYYGYTEMAKLLREARCSKGCTEET